MIGGLAVELVVTPLMSCGKRGWPLPTKPDLIDMPVRARHSRLR